MGIPLWRSWLVKFSTVFTTVYKSGIHYDYAWDYHRINKFINHKHNVQRGQKRGKVSKYKTLLLPVIDNSNSVLSNAKYFSTFYYFFFSSQSIPIKIP